MNIKAGFPWDFLANCRLAKRSEFGMLQLFPGREMRRDVTGMVPEMHSVHSGWKAPSFFVKALVENTANSINWEWVYAIVRDVTGVPIPRHTVSRFTDDARYTGVDWLAEVADIGSTVLQAWGVDNKDKLQGSFRSILGRHKRALKMSSKLKVAPKGTFLTNEFYGAWPILSAALQSQKDNYASFVAMSPAQIVITGSTVDVTRSLRPYVPNDSVHHQMASRAAKEEASMMQHRLQLPHFYNVGHDEVVVSPHSYSMGMV